MAQVKSRRRERALPMSSTVKALTVLETVAGAGESIPLGEIARRADMTKPTAHRILQTLRDAGYVLTDGKGGYSAGPRLLGLAGLTLRHRDYDRHVLPHLRRLRDQTGHTVHFALLAGDSAVYVEKVEPEGAYKLASRVGMHMPLHSTAIGKAMLPELAESDARSRVGEEPYAVRTEATHSTWAELSADLREIRERGYAIDDEENELNVRCVAAPVHDSLARVSGAVSVSALTFLFSLEDAHRAGALVHDAAVAVSRALGAPAAEPEAP